MSRGVITLAALDARPRPDHRSELVSQLLLGETVQVLGSDPAGQWLRVRNDADGYVGWVRAWGVRLLAPSAAERWRRRARGLICVSFAEVRSGPGRGHLLTPAFWNGRLVTGPSQGPHRRVELPDGRTGWIRSRALAGPGRPPGIVARIRRLLGTPYLWGGRTPLGFDCSGFVQQLLAEQGRSLPRDAHEQFRSSAPVVDLATLAMGDLLFFGRSRARVGHVALALGRGYYAHCRGWVRINSIDPGNTMYDKELFGQLVGCGRPSSGRSGTPRRRSLDLETT